MTTPERTSAFDIIRDQFRQWGLGSLAENIQRYITDGISPQEALIRLRETKEYKTRFVGNTTRLAKGLRPLSEAEYLSAEERLREQFRSYELPPGFYDSPDDFSKAIGADLGAGELRERLEARKAILTDGAATGVLDYARRAYGLGTGDLLAYFIDPDRAAPIITKMARASQVGAAAARTGWGGVTRAEAERLDALGVNAAAAEAGFSQAANLLELTADVDDAGISRDDITGAIFDQNADAARRVTRKQDERRARFAGGGTFAESRTGFAGLGSAAT